MPSFSRPTLTSASGPAPGPIAAEAEEVSSGRRPRRRGRVIIVKDGEGNPRSSAAEVVEVVEAVDAATEAPEEVEVDVELTDELPARRRKPKVEPCAFCQYGKPALAGAAVGAVAAYFFGVPVTSGALWGAGGGLLYGGVSGGFDDTRKR